jgi:two-component system invasion response regulator UvrY
MNPVILIADDHSLIRRGLKLNIELDLGYFDIYEVSSCNELMRELVRKRYTHLILDIILSDGNSLEVIPNIRRVYPQLNVMVFSMQSEDVYSNALKQYNIHRYLSKTAEERDITKALSAFFHNEKMVNHTIQAVNHNPFVNLTPRELEILHYLLKGLGTKEISEILNITMSTVSTLKNHIFEKTNAQNLKELLELASLYNINF